MVQGHFPTCSDYKNCSSGRVITLPVTPSSTTSLSPMMPQESTADKSKTFYYDLDHSSDHDLRASSFNDNQTCVLRGPGIPGNVDSDAEYLGNHCQSECPCPEGWMPLPMDEFGHYIYSQLPLIQEMGLQADSPDAASSDSGAAQISGKSQKVRRVETHPLPLTRVLHQDTVAEVPHTEPHQAADHTLNTLTRRRSQDAPYEVRLHRLGMNIRLRVFLLTPYHFGDSITNNRVNSVSLHPRKC